MRITAELSLYPLSEDPIPKIVAFIESLAADRDVELVVNQMSTQLCGELDAVVACVSDALRRSFSTESSQVLVAKFLNAELPITDPPDLASRD
jgi:uncharacterized protein YqgV (UPF0045/DUF77 family)